MHAADAARARLIENEYIAVKIALVMADVIVMVMFCLVLCDGFDRAMQMCPTTTTLFGGKEFDECEIIMNGRAEKSSIFVFFTNRLGS